ncbi:MAG TPA: 4-alpha-glucanotransferase [Stenomitos sp.]
MAFSRGSGILFHLTSLPGPHGIGDLGREAHRFVEFLAIAGQKYWQLLPLGHTGYGDSPYAAFSAFAGNPLLISLERFVEEGWFPAEELTQRPAFPGHEVDYGAVIPWKMAMLRKAFAHFEARHPELPVDMRQFCYMSADWLEDYAFFMALKDHHQGEPWDKWEPGARYRDPGALAYYAHELAADVRFYRFLQFQFFRQYTALKQHANGLGITIVGDMPIFVAYDSADTWAHQGLFLLDRGRPVVVAGVPPDYFSKTGQLWGNPLYNWEAMAYHGYDWWVARMRMALAMFDIVRIDHFRGFAACWAIPYGDENAVRGWWMKAPGHQLFETLEAHLGRLPIMAEDLGVITPDVERLRDRFGFPGMKVLQFAFGSDRANPYLPENHTVNSVVYTGTHDNDTTLGWYRQATRKERTTLRRYTGTDGSRIALDLMRVAMASPASMAITPLQDLLELGTEARMNTPGQKGGNWRWRVARGQISGELAGGLKAFTREFRR